MRHLLQAQWKPKFASNFCGFLLCNGENKSCKTSSVRNSLKKMTQSTVDATCSFTGVNPAVSESPIALVSVFVPLFVAALVVAF